MKFLLPSVCLSAALFAGIASVQAEVPRTSAPAGAQVYFIEPADGAEVGQTFTVKFGLKGMGVAPAGIQFENTGHHHLIIDSDLPPPGQPIPTDDKHVHFGKGQTEATIELAPGKHTLQLLLGDFGHVPHDPVLASKKIPITVK